MTELPSPKLRRAGIPRRKSSQGSLQSSVETGYPASGVRFPLVYKPRLRDIDPQGWAQANRESILQELSRHSALLFRGFRIESIAEFEAFAQALCPDLYGEYGDLPKQEEGKKVYHSTPYPSDIPILFHNESSHQHRWPMKQFFFSIIVAEEGGETPLVDCREIYRRLDPELRDLFARKKLRYVRNFIKDIDVSWRDFFHTDDRREVERRCREAVIEFEWKGDILKTQQLAPALARHPETGEMVFFNQLQLHHVSTLEPGLRKSLLSAFGEENLPRTVLFGDETPIEDSIIEEITRLYWECSVAFPWEVGDVVMVDNMLCAHARNPFSGPRKIAVAMGEMVSASEIVDLTLE